MIYSTNPLVYDTDGDGVGDGEEIMAGTDPLDAERSLLAAPEASFGIFGNPTKFVWYFARATGILSFILLTIVVVHGLVVSSRAFIRVYPATIALETHRFLSWIALGTVMLHFGSFLFDDFMRMSITEILIPFLLQRDFRTTLGYDIGQVTTLGIIAFYLILILVLTSEFRSKMSTKLWRAIHYSSFVAYPLFLVHGILTGTDSRELWMQVVYIVSGVLVSMLIVIRIIFRNILPKIRARRTVVQAVVDSSSHTEVVS
jgi:predicted ferric reductase